MNQSITTPVYLQPIKGIERRYEEDRCTAGNRI